MKILLLRLQWSIFALRKWAKEDHKNIRVSKKMINLKLEFIAKECVDRWSNKVGNRNYYFRLGTLTKSYRRELFTSTRKYREYRELMYKKLILHLSIDWIYNFNQGNHVYSYKRMTETAVYLYTTKRCAGEHLQPTSRMWRWTIAIDNILKVKVCAEGEETLSGRWKAWQKYTKK